ncbi:hypothetical protein MPSEU_000625200 [Mayamaea pseudoterrestris]|nr:hypothetical protein MPSEU_000625200 [Mayamaea pseudoterrestris]
MTAVSLATASNVVTTILLLLSASLAVNAQGGNNNNPVVGVDVCACQPATYEFKLDFGIDCSDKTVVSGAAGINDTACIVNTEQQVNVTDFSPVRVTTIQILELNQDLRVIAQTPLSGDFRSGDTFKYTSVIAQIDPDEENVDMIPKGLQITLAGRNAEEQDLVNFWLIIYENDCGVFPVVLEGQQIGWTVFNDLGVPPFGLCPAAGPAPTESPTSRPSLRPTVTKETPTTKAPTRAPVIFPTTESPTESVSTRAPSRPPSTREPTRRPITREPARRPTTREPTRRPSTPEPTRRPAAASRPVTSGSASIPSGSIASVPHSPVSSGSASVPTGSIESIPHSSVSSGSVDHAPVPLVRAPTVSSSKASAPTIKCVPRPLPKKKERGTPTGSGGHGFKLQRPTARVSKASSDKTGNGGKGNSGSNGVAPPEPGIVSGSTGTGMNHFGGGSIGHWPAASSSGDAGTDDLTNDDNNFVNDDETVKDPATPPQSGSGARRRLMTNSASASGSKIRYTKKKAYDAKSTAKKHSKIEEPGKGSSKKSVDHGQGIKRSKGTLSQWSGSSGISKGATGSNGAAPSKGLDTHDPESGLPYCVEPATPLVSSGSGHSSGSVNVPSNSRRTPAPSTDDGSSSNQRPIAAKPSTLVGGSEDQGAPSPVLRPSVSQVDNDPTDAPFVPATLPPIFAPSIAANEVPEPAATSSTTSDHVSSLAAQSAGNPWGFFGTPPKTNTDEERDNEKATKNIFGGHERQRRT